MDLPRVGPRGSCDGNRRRCRKGMIPKKKEERNSPSPKSGQDRACPRREVILPFQKNRFNPELYETRFTREGGLLLVTISTLSKMGGTCQAGILSNGEPEKGNKAADRRRGRSLRVRHPRPVDSGVSIPPGWLPIPPRPLRPSGRRLLRVFAPARNEPSSGEFRFLSRGSPEPAGYSARGRQRGSRGEGLLPHEAGTCADPGCHRWAFQWGQVHP